MAHATVNAALALASNNNALAGAAGATLGEAMGMIALNYYGKNVDELSEQQNNVMKLLPIECAEWNVRARVQGASS